MTEPRQLRLFETEEDRPSKTRVSAPEPAGLTSYGRCEISELRARLAPLLATEPLGQLILTDNRSRILSSKRNASGELDVRIHRCFTSADGATLEAVAAFVSGRARGALRKRMLAILRRHFSDHKPEESNRARRRLILRPVGEHYDLLQLRDTLNLEYFGGQLEVQITWGRAPKRRKKPRGRFSIRLGSYSESDNVIRLHPALDRAFVPRYVVESVVYHELLHAALPPEHCNGRRRLHTPEFRRRERHYRFFNRAEKWLQANLERLVLGF